MAEPAGNGAGRCVREDRRFAFAGRRAIGMIAGVSDWLVDLQSTIAGYPAWLVVLCGLVVVAGVFMLLGKVLRMVGVLVMIGAVAAAGWFACQHFFGGGPDQTSPPAVQQTPAF